jgi:hypothetical protein
METNIYTQGGTMNSFSAPLRSFAAFASLLFLAAATFSSAKCDSAAKEKPDASLYGRCTQLDPGFRYFHNRTLNSIAEEVKANGFQSVSMTVTSAGRYPLSDVLARHGLGVRVLFLPMNGGWVGDKFKEWRMVHKDPNFHGDDGYAYFCMNNPDFREYRQKQLVDILLKNPAFTAIDLAEPQMPAWGGPDQGSYGCLCDKCKKKFLSLHPEETAIPDFYDPSSPKFWKTDKELYRKWVDFRARTVIDFIDFIVNGSGGIRSRCPRVKVITWTLGCQAKNGDVVEIEREWQGMDAAAMVAKVKPDAHCIQTDWPDWANPALSAEYAAAYAPYVESIRKVNKTIPVTMQTDSGSNPDMHRSFEWLHRFDAEAKRVGFVQTLDYQYHLSADFYQKPPRLAKSELSASGKRLTLVYNMYLDPKIAGDASNYKLSQGRVAGVKIDGNIVYLHVENTKVGATITIARMGNNPDALCHKGSKQTIAGLTTAVIAEAGT